jgi:hypothetical protein
MTSQSRNSLQPTAYQRKPPRQAKPSLRKANHWDKPKAKPREATVRKANH